MVIGISVSPEVLSTKNMISAFEAVSFLGFNSCNSFIAFKPSGVAALSRPSILADKFINMVPMAGWLRGTSGKILQKNGAVRRDRNPTAPPRSPIFIMPSHSDSTPVSPMEISKPVLADANIESITAFSTEPSPDTHSCSNATATAVSKNPIQI